MKKRYLILFSLALTIVGVFYFWPEEIKIKPPPQSVKVISENRKLFLGKRSSLPIDQSKTKSTCDLLLSQLNELDLSGEISDWDDRVNALSFESCVDKDVIEKAQLVKATCIKKDETCQAELTMLRALLRTRGVSSSQDPHMIADLILGEFAKKEPDFKKLEKLVNELLTQNPENQAYQKLWAMNKLMANIDKKPFPSELQEEIYTRLDPEILNHPDLMSYRLFLETELNPEKAEAFARSYLSEFPNRSDALEALGWSLWQQGRRPEALKELEKAIALNPKDLWLKDMYIKLKSPNADRGTYKGRMNMGVRFEDLYQ